MQRKALLIVLGVAVCLAAFLLKLRADHGGEHGPADRGREHGLTVEVSVQASDTSTTTLRYQWRSTDGVIRNVNSATTTWTLPSGPWQTMANKVTFGLPPLHTLCAQTTAKCWFLLEICTGNSEIAESFLVCRLATM